MAAMEVAGLPSPAPEERHSMTVNTWPLPVRLLPSERFLPRCWDHSPEAMTFQATRNNGRARDAKPLLSQHLHSLSDRWALRINSLYVCWPSAEPAASACSWPPWLLSTPWLPRQSLESPRLRQRFNRWLFLLLRDSQGCWGACYFGKSATFTNAL